MPPRKHTAEELAWAKIHGMKIGITDPVKFLNTKYSALLIKLEALGLDLVFVAMPESKEDPKKEERRNTRKELKCSYCRPHKGENKKYKKHGAKKSRKKA